MTCSMTAATGTVAFASDDAATEEAADDTEAAAEDVYKRQLQRTSQRNHTDGSRTDR